MSQAEEFSSERLNAFVDDELDARERDEILAALSDDPALAHKICELRAEKDLVRHAYGAAQVPAPSRRRRPGGGWGALAAGLLLGIGILVGWQGHRAVAGADAGLPVTASRPAGVLIHLDTSADDRMEETLDLAEAYVAKAGHAKVEIVVNNSGLNLLRAETSPYAERIARLSTGRDMLSFVACGYAISRYRNAGHQVTLLPGTQVAPTAIEHVVDRVREGWTYVKI